MINFLSSEIPSKNLDSTYKLNIIIALRMKMEKPSMYFVAGGQTKMIEIINADRLVLMDYPNRRNR